MQLQRIGCFEARLSSAAQRPWCVLIIEGLLKVCAILNVLMAVEVENFKVVLRVHAAVITKTRYFFSSI